MALAAYIVEDGPCRASIGGKALGPVKARYPCVRECQDRDVRGSGWKGEGAPSWRQG